MSLGLSDGQYPGLQRIQAADPMTKHQVGTREQWLAARRALLEREKQLTRRSDDLARERQRLPWVPVDETYTFQTSDGPKTLAELLPGALSCSSTTPTPATTAARTCSTPGGSSLSARRTGARTRAPRVGSAAGPTSSLPASWPPDPDRILAAWRYTDGHGSRDIPR